MIGNTRLRTLLAQEHLGFDLLRIYLGIGLFVRGVIFLREPSVLGDVLGDDWFLPLLGVHAVAMAHFVGGALLAVGCYTRLAAAVQLPPVIAATFLLHLKEGLFDSGQSLELSALVLVMLLLYVAFGGGPLSVDRLLTSARELSAAPAPSVWPPAPVALAPPVTSVVSDAVLPLPQAAPTQSPDGGFEAWSYRDAKLALASAFGGITLLFVLLAEDRYDWAVMWFLASFVTFGVWRVGRAQFR